MRPLIIEIPRNGIAPSPHVGVADCRNLDIWTSPGVVRLNNLVAKRSASVILDTVNWMVKNPAEPSHIYALDESGNVYKSSNSGTTWVLMLGNIFTVTIASPGVFSDVAHGLAEDDQVRFTTTGALPTGLAVGTTYHVIAAGLTADAFQVSATSGGAAINTSGTQSGVHSMFPYLGKTGCGLKIWKGYLFVCRKARIDVCGTGVASGIANDKWTFNWQTIDTDTLWHPLLISNNDSKLYGGAGRYVFSLDEVTGQTFAPATAATFTFTSQALDLPPNYRIKCLTELGNNLMCGTWQTESGDSPYVIRIADIFPWDRSSPSFGQPIVMAENGVHAMLNTGNSLVVLAGVGGTIYRSDGVNVHPIAQIPHSIADISNGKYLETFPGAICNYKGKPYFGISSGGGANTVDGMGVYSLAETSKGNILVFEHGISEGTTGSGETIKIQSLLPLYRDSILIGWRDNTDYGIDSITTSSFATGYTGFFDSPLFAVGSSLQKAQYNQIELQFARPLRTNEGVRIQYRDDLTASFATVDDFDFTTYGAVQTIQRTFSENINIPKSEFLQIRCLLTGTTTTPELRQVIIR